LAVMPYLVASAPIKANQAKPILISLDAQLTTQLQVGNPAQKLQVGLNMDDSALTLAGQNCKLTFDTSKSCTTTPYDSSKSKSAKSSGQTFNNAGVYKGKIGTDDVTLGPLKSSAQQLYIADNVQFVQTALVGTKLDGTLGLHPNTTGVSLVKALATAKQIPAAIWGLKTSNPAELSLGGPNPTKYKGDIQFTTFSASDFEAPTFGFVADSITINGVKAFNGVSMSIDTTATSSMFSKNINDLIFKGTTLVHNATDGSFTYPCNKAPGTVSINVGSLSMCFDVKSVLGLKPVSPGSSTCKGEEYSDGTVGALTLPFMNTVYTVMNYDTNQVGFAKLA